MYAVIRAGGKQYRVAPGDVIEIEKLAKSTGDNVQFDDVLAVSATEGEIAKPAAAFVTGKWWSRGVATRYWCSTTSARSSIRSYRGIVRTTRR